MLHLQQAAAARAVVDGLGDGPSPLATGQTSESGRVFHCANIPLWTLSNGGKEHRQPSIQSTTARIFRRRSGSQAEALEHPTAESLESALVTVGWGEVSTPRVSRAPAPLVALCAAALVSCSRQPELDEVFEPPRPVEAFKAPSGVLTEFELAPNRRAELALGSRQRRVQGHVALTRGFLHLDLADLTASRGQLTFDLTTLEIDRVHADEVASASELTERARFWLEVAHRESVAAQPQLQYAHFVIQSVGGASARSAAEGRVVKAAPGTLGARRVELKVTGTLELHGFRIPYTAGVLVTFHWVHSAPPASAPDQVEVSLSEGMGVDLLAHGIVPRDARGDVLADALAELRKPRAHVAQVTGNWLAVRSRAPAGVLR